jgi:putative hydrolase of the HAD superfamily
MLGGVPALLPGVEKGLALLREAGLPVHIMTEGRIEKQKKILEHHSISNLVGTVYEMAKNEAQFERMRLRFAPSGIVVIGDQPDRDIVPAKAAQCQTVFVPGRFRPHWHSDDQAQKADFVAPTFLDAAKWVTAAGVPAPL